MSDKQIQVSAEHFEALQGEHKAAMLTINSIVELLGVSETESISGQVAALKNQIDAQRLALDGLLSRDESAEWSGWACQYPGSLPKVYGDLAIAGLNCDAGTGQRLIFLSSKPAVMESMPEVSFYLDGIKAAANWVDQQREDYETEHGRRDNDTGSFEFGNDAQREYSDTLVDIAEGIRALHPNTTSQLAPAAVAVPVVQDGISDIIERFQYQADHLSDWHHIDEHSCKVNRRDLMTALDFMNTCRAAMLQEKLKSAGVTNNCRSNEKVQDLQVANSPVIPDCSAIVPFSTRQLEVK